MGTLFINIIGLAVIGLIIWWFWLSTPKAQKVQKNFIDVVVDGGTYTPSRIEVEAGRDVTLRFLRKDPSPCAEKVVFEELGVSADLPLNVAKEIVVTPSNVGTYSFTCQMHMYKGSLVAK
jgi:plastocyanin domain-containing protein